jgi:hypothetical protein
MKPTKYGISIDDLPEGALGMPEVIFEDNIDFEEVFNAIKGEEADYASSDAGCKQPSD